MLLLEVKMSFGFLSSLRKWLFGEQVNMKMPELPESKYTLDELAAALPKNLRDELLSLSKQCREIARMNYSHMEDGNMVVETELLTDEENQVFDREEELCRMARKILEAGCVSKEVVA